jgi:hypothetical protein
MNQIEALKFLGIDSVLDAEEAIENKIFEIKNEIIASCHVPKLILAKQKKLKQLVSICEILHIHLEINFEKFELEHLDSESILETFNYFHKNRAFLLQKITSNSDLNLIVYTCDLLYQNLRNWAYKWPILESDVNVDVKLSKELESVEMLRMIKNLNERNVFNFNDLKSKNTPNDLMIEIQRLNELARYFDTIESN